jgi:O-antigen/teichoic acid export membrane protein
MASYIIFFHNTVYYQRITYSKQAVYVLALVLLISDYGIFGVALAFFIRSVYTLLMTIMYYKRIRYGDA